MVNRAYQPSTIHFPTYAPECNDTERRSLIKINQLLDQMLPLLTTLAQPGGASVGLTTYLYGLLMIGPVGADLLDVACYNQTDVDVWVQIFGQPPSGGQTPLLPIRVYAHNHAYYEALTSAASFVANRYYIVVSSAENVMAVNSTPVFLAVRHS